MADVLLVVGKKSEVMTDEKREAAKELAEDLRSSGVDADLEIIEYEPGRRGIGLIEWMSVFVGTPVASTLSSKITSDVYELIKKKLQERRKAKKERGEAGRHQGFIIYGPDGKELRRWDTREDDRREDDRREDDRKD